MPERTCAWPSNGFQMDSARWSFCWPKSMACCASASSLTFIGTFQHNEAVFFNGNQCCERTVINQCERCRTCRHWKLLCLKVAPLSIAFFLISNSPFAECIWILAGKYLSRLKLAERIGWIICSSSSESLEKPSSGSVWPNPFPFERGAITRELATFAARIVSGCSKANFVECFPWAGSNFIDQEH